MQILCGLVSICVHICLRDVCKAIDGDVFLCDIGSQNWSHGPSGLPVSQSSLHLKGQK